MPGERSSLGIGVEEIVIQPLAIITGKNFWNCAEDERTKSRHGFITVELTQSRFLLRLDKTKGCYLVQRESTKTLDSIEPMVI